MNSCPIINEPIAYHWISSHYSIDSYLSSHYSIDYSIDAQYLFGKHCFFKQVRFFLTHFWNWLGGLKPWATCGMACRHVYRWIGTFHFFEHNGAKNKRGNSGTNAEIRGTNVEIHGMKSSVVFGFESRCFGLLALTCCVYIPQGFYISHASLDLGCLALLLEIWWQFESKP